MKNKKIIFIVLVVIIVLGGANGAKYYYELSSYRKAVNAISIGEIDLTVIPDGIYTGSFNTIWIKATVEVTVKGHRIVDIMLDHYHDRGETADVIPDKVIAAQSLQVDTISGATNSSKIILKAIENALRSALQ